MVRPPLRTKTISSKVSDEEYAALEARAGAAVRAWPSGSAARLRTIVLNLLYRLANGEKVSEKQMRQLIERADGEKVERAAERLALARASD